MLFADNTIVKIPDSRRDVVLFSQGDTMNVQSPQMGMNNRPKYTSPKSNLVRPVDLFSFLFLFLFR